MKPLTTMNSHQHVRCRRDTESGFTLIELLVVILIIGILAAIAVPMFLNQRRAAVDASLKSDMKNLATELETWQVQNPTARRYPSAAWRPNDTGSHNLANLSFQPTEGNYLRTYTTHPLIEADKGFCIQAWSAGSSEYRTESTAMMYVQRAGGITEDGSDYMANCLGSTP